MIKHPIYEEIKLLAKEKNWKICFFDGDSEGNNVIKVYDFKTGETSTAHKFSSSNDLVDIIPSISQHGDKIGFWQKEDSGRDSLYIINTDGSNLDKIMTVTTGHWVLWSPDDKKIAFGASLVEKNSLEGRGTLYMVDIKDKRAEVVIEDQADGITNQSLSSDGEKILYSYKGIIMSYDFLTKERQELTNGDWFAWSPNGDWVAYLDGDKINIINPRTFMKETLVESDRITAPIYWLPNGEYIVYGVFENEHAEVGQPHVIRLSDRKTESVLDSFWMLASWSK